MRFTTFLSLLPSALAHPVAERAEPAPLYLHETEAQIAARGTSGRFIVKFERDSPLPIMQSALGRISSDDVVHILENRFPSFTARLDREIVEMLRMVPGVEYIEQDTTVSIAGSLSQRSSPWGLARISHRNPGSKEYHYDESAGEGVCVYVLDSGIDDRHPEFQGRAHQIKSFVNGSDVDDVGHGTHCAGIIGSASYGVAKKATLYGVKILDKKQDCWSSDVIAAYSFVRGDVSSRSCPNGVVLNVSLGGEFNTALNEATSDMADAGYFIAVSAGNNSTDASLFSPASSTKACTVGGTQSDDKRYKDSNWGPAIDINAPAVEILSTLPNFKSGYRTGTSMATPHIAGLAAYLATKNGVLPSPSLCDTIVNMSISGAIKDQARHTINNIANNGNL